MEKVTVKELMEQFQLHPPKDMAPCKRLYDVFKGLFIERSVQDGLVDLCSLSLAGDGTPVYIAAKERKKRTCSCLEKGIKDCKCNRVYSPAAASKRESRTASVIVSTASLTVTSAGIPTGSAGIVTTVEKQ
ncbi:MAG: hypothetical protein HFH43_11335 [Lachnospiraceae bacterium]|nr:hypothetical protein [Lachnospiraceae bacterium]